MDPLLQNCIPTVPSDTLNPIVMVVGALGGVLLVYSVFIERENRQDLIRVVGGLAMMVYALSIQNMLFIVVMAAIAVTSAIEFIEIYLGLHKHAPHELGRLKKLSKNSKK